MKRFLNYPGKVDIVVGQPMGPTLSGQEILWVTGGTYDVEADKTRLELSYIAPKPEVTA